MKKDDSLRRVAMEAMENAADGERRFRRIFLIVLDSLGVGAMPDADSFGDAGAHQTGDFFGRERGVRGRNKCFND